MKIEIKIYFNLNNKNKDVYKFNYISYDILIKINSIFLISHQL